MAVSLLKKSGSDLNMKCKCGEEAELKVFNTFEYYYCKKCKKEITTEEPPKKEDSGNPFDGFYLDLACKKYEEELEEAFKSFIRNSVNNP